jgi:hypothetical protein
VPFPDFEAICRTGIGARKSFAFPADLFLYQDMPIFIDVIFIDGQFILDVRRRHNDLFI